MGKAASRYAVWLLAGATLLAPAAPALAQSQVTAFLNILPGTGNSSWTKGDHLNAKLEGQKLRVDNVGGAPVALNKALAVDAAGKQSRETYEIERSNDKLLGTYHAVWPSTDTEDGAIACEQKPK